MHENADCLIAFNAENLEATEKTSGNGMVI